jgi:hypothetical protein
MKFVADAAGDRFAIFEGHWEIGAEPIVGARRAGVPARPDDRVAASQQKAEAGVARGLRIVDRDRVVRRHVVEELQDPLAAAVGHVIDEDAAALPRHGRTQHEEIGGVVDEARFIARRLIEIDDAGVFRRLRIERTARHAANAHIRCPWRRLPEFMAGSAMCVLRDGRFAASSG